MQVAFTEFVRPNAVQRIKLIDVPSTPELAAKLKAIIERGLSLEYEMLNTGVQSITIEDWSRDSIENPTVASELIFPGQVVSLNVIDLINTAYENICLSKS